MKQGIVLLAHGSRDPQWSLPFERLAGDLGRRLPAVAIALAYLEHGTQLHEAISQLTRQSAVSIRVVPVFLGQGGHVKEDLPRLVAAAQREFAGAEIRLEPPVGEQPPVIAALAAFIAAGSAAR
jgi:sirohydrochlorin cobaltochelatase